MEYWNYACGGSGKSACDSSQQALCVNSLTHALRKSVAEACKGNCRSRSRKVDERAVYLKRSQHHSRHNVKHKDTCGSKLCIVDKHLSHGAQRTAYDECP